MELSTFATPTRTRQAAPLFAVMQLPAFDASEYHHAISSDFAASQQAVVSSLAHPRERFDRSSLARPRARFDRSSLARPRARFDRARQHDRMGIGLTPAHRIVLLHRVASPHARARRQ